MSTDADMDLVSMDGDMVKINFNLKCEVNDDGKSTDSYYYDSVTFHDICESYLPDIDIQCKYSYKKEITPSTYDWIGLIKIGWSSYKDYISYVWAVTPDETNDQEKMMIINFLKKNLPGDDGEFYQFLYISKDGHVRGDSTPFQFRKPRADDFIEDEDDDLLVISHSKTLLEGKLKGVEDEHEKLRQIYEGICHERDGLYIKEAVLKQELDLTHEKVRLEKDLHLDTERKLNECQAEKDKLLTKLSVIQAEIAELTLTAGKVRKMKDENDSLMGDLRNLQEEKSLIQNSLSTQEQISKKQAQAIEELTKQQEADEKVKNDKDILIRNLQETIPIEQAKVAELQTKCEQNEDTIKELEGQLEASHAKNTLLKSENDAYMETQQKLSRALENSEMEISRLRLEEIVRLSDKVTSLTETNKELEVTLSTKSSELEVVKFEMNEKLFAEETRASELREKLEKLNVDNERANDKVEELEHFKASIYVMQKAQTVLQQQLLKSKRSAEEHRRQLIITQKNCDEREGKLKKQNLDLKERVKMCWKEYDLLQKRMKKFDRKFVEIPVTADLFGENESEGSYGAKANPDVSPYNRSQEKQFNFADNDLRLRTMEKLLAAQSNEIDELRRQLANRSNMEKDYTAAVVPSCSPSPYTSDTSSKGQGYSPLIYPKPENIYPQEISERMHVLEDISGPPSDSGLVDPATNIPSDNLIEPLTPEVTYGAKMAEVLSTKSTQDLDSDILLTTDYSETEVKELIGDSASSTLYFNAVHKRQRICHICLYVFPPDTLPEIIRDHYFHDHDGCSKESGEVLDSLQLGSCPICYLDFKDDVPAEVIRCHLKEHEREPNSKNIPPASPSGNCAVQCCPMCQLTFAGYLQDDIERHVLGHFPNND